MWDRTLTIAFVAAVLSCPALCLGQVQPKVYGPTPRNDSVVSVDELKNSGKAESDFAKATLLLRRGDAAASLHYFQRAIAKEPTYYRAYHNFGLALYLLGQVAQAEESFQKSIDLTNGGYAPSEFALGMILMEKQEFRQAEKLIQLGLNVEPASAPGKYLLGLAQFSDDRLADAEKSARDALRQDTHEVNAYILLAMIHSKNHNPYAVVTDAESYLRLDPHGPLQDEASSLLRRARQQIEGSTLNR